MDISYGNWFSKISNEFKRMEFENLIEKDYSRADLEIYLRDKREKKVVLVKILKGSQNFQVNLGTMSKNYIFHNEFDIEGQRIHVIDDILRKDEDGHWTYDFYSVD